MVGLADLKLVVSFDEIKGSFLFVFTDQKCIIAEHVRESLSKFFGSDVDVNFESQYFELVESEEF